jgi:hypothetical protein
MFGREAVSDPHEIPTNALRRACVDHRHSVKFYGNDSSMIEFQSQQVSAAPAAGQAVVVIGTPPHRKNTGASIDTFWASTSWGLRVKGGLFRPLVAAGKEGSLDRIQEIFSSLRAQIRLPERGDLEN